VSVNYREQDFVEAVKVQTQGRGVDVVLDIVGASYFERNIASLAKDGRLISIGFFGGSVVERFDLGRIISKRISITGSTMRPRTAHEKANIASDLRTSLWPHLGQEKIAPMIYATFPLEQAAAAHQLMESSQHIGKIVLTCD
jgi:NADPH:quinone reductase-like Zn-dependent oxidoreductase